MTANAINSEENLQALEAIQEKATAVTAAIHDLRETIRGLHPVFVEFEEDDEANNG